MSEYSGSHSSWESAGEVPDREPPEAAPPIDRFAGDYRFLSNFYPSPIEIDVDGPTTVATVEHAYQALKTTDRVQRRTIALAPKPGEAKRRGRRCAIRPGWDDLKLGVMRALLEQKFAPGSEFAKALIATGDRELIEGNYWGDRYWGVCDGEGENHLGRLLMEIRAALS